ncbi:MAG TPA: hypothetical protein VGF29_00380 [Hyphomicrobiaceae bacterium]|jgi:hypothetical protein
MTHHLELDTIILSEGGHSSRDQGVCLLEAVAWWAEEDHSDQPECVSPILGMYGRSLNDVLPDGKRQRLTVYIPQLPGTAGDGLDERRGYIALDWLVRTYLPAWLRLVPALIADADLLAQHGPVETLEDAAAVGEIVRDAESHTVTAGDAAGYAAWTAARDAAWDAAWDAAGAAARDAGGDAAWTAAGAAAWTAAWTAADAVRTAVRAAARAAVRAALKPTVEQLQDSAITLFGELIRADATTTNGGAR